ncbi:molybdopterin molybdotransferase MoeA [Hydrogenophaga sp. PBL-H3]|uniref:molybdopterin molybdotransferase MoeA n=1 Tax=Hydrogenophaga sp. PBL-H3 TaxID=434010 RepID=UPI0013203A67|nr:molybdopterin molybdotransferase MoeA [Hydrogenophaga sp. PBL-H3]QHE76629.1 molybdopterin molybdotransferase MoeA [Hydrogenophaga sp. PBL-H3]QHE81053.1 molybdopterin molybdotransferase MoeA [Hydrogenophaga sp. PBL-H3]
MKTMEQIAAELQGYDPQALSAGQVNEFLAHLVEPVTTLEEVGVFEALDRVLAVDVVSPISVPPHDNSAMDGFAFDSRLLQPGQPLKLRVAGTAFAGKAWAGALGADQCLKIMTGAIMPGALDTVVPLEFVKVDGDVVEIPPGVVKAGDNRRLLGEDLMAGQPALRKGQTLGPAALGLIASLGLPTVTVFRRIRVAYFSTGDEILTLGEPIREGAVFDSNRYTVFGLLKRMGVDVIDMGVVRDEPALLEAAFRSAALQADAIITSGGVSMGEADHTKAMMKQLGDVAFWRIAMRPGRPMAVGRITSPHAPPLRGSLPPEGAESGLGRPGAGLGEAGKSSVLFGLPGNPVAVMVTFLAFVRPALQRLMGATVTQPVLLQAHSLEPLRKKPGRTEYQRGIVGRAADGTLTVRITGNQGSGVLSSMVEANGLIVLHHGQGNVAVGDRVDVMMFDGAI